jgi:hypothetical protein
VTIVQYEFTDPTLPMTAETATDTYVSTPYGLFTTAGHWYHIPESEARAYAGAVLDHVSLDTLVRWADAWVESPRTVALWALPALLWALPVGWAVGAALGLYVAWALGSPSVPAVAAARTMTVLQRRAVQGLFYAGALSALAVTGHLPATFVGLGAFVLFRWGVLDWTAQIGLRPLQQLLYPLPVTDQVLRGLIVRAALKHRVSVPQVDALATDILANWHARTDADPDPVSSTPPE